MVFAQTDDVDVGLESKKMGEQRGSGWVSVCVTIVLTQGSRQLRDKLCFVHVGVPCCGVIYIVSIVAIDVIVIVVVFVAGPAAAATTNVIGQRTVIERRYFL